MTQIKPNIDIADADETHCNGCRKKIYNYYDIRICGVYGTECTYDIDEDKFLRLDECKADEVKE